MEGLLLSATVLLLLIFLLRVLPGRWVSRRLVYGLWLLAAARLLISQAALSQHVKKLETELDARLFQRQHGHLVLTDAGRVYVNGARRVLDIYNRALYQIYHM